MSNDIPDDNRDGWVRPFDEGVRHFAAGRWAEAADCFQTAAACKPNDAGILFNLALAFRGLGHGHEALALLLHVAKMRPDHVPTLFQLATLLVELRKGPEALVLFEHVVRTQPDFMDAALRLGNLLVAAGRPEQAEAAYRIALTLDPASADAMGNLGAALMGQRRVAAAILLYRRAVRLEPNRAEFHKNLGCCLVASGSFEDGVQEYEWRTRLRGWPWRREFPGKAAWDGSSLAGKTILVHFEQGFGDTFQFVRYFPLLKGMGARTIFECQPQLKRVLATAPGIDTLLAHGEALPDFDCYAPLLSLPRLCRTTLQTIPGGVPYLRAEPDQVRHWQKRMGEQAFRVGIHWHANGASRTIPLDAFTALARLPGVRLYSLQQAVGLDALKAPPPGLDIVSWPEADLDCGGDAFVASAAIMAGMDLMICCDSAINHLAGAMGLPVLLVLPWQGDWRWMNIPDRTPWYPRTRLFRMAQQESWNDVMTRVSVEVARLAGLPRG